MSKIVDELKVSGKEEIAYVKSLHLDPDIDKVDENSSEDLLTQLAKIKKLDQKELEERLEKCMVLIYLKNKHYNMIREIMLDKSIPIENKFAMFGRKRPLYIIPRLLLIVEIILVTAAMAWFCIFLLPKVLLWSIGVVYAVMVITKAKPAFLFHKFLAKLYFLPFKVWR